jgi:hypothetical protein
MFKGVPVYGQHATGFFDPAGNLHALNARLLPMDAALDVTPNLTASGAVAALQGFQGSLDVTVFGQDGKPEASSVDRSEALSPDAQSAELMLLPVERGSGRFGAVSSKVDYRLAWDLHLRKGLLQIHAFVDARSGEILFASNETPSGWWDEGTTSFSTGMDELNVRQSFYTTNFGNQWYLAGLGKDLGKPWLASGSFLMVSDSYSASSRWRPNNVCITIPTQVNGAANSWESDPTFNAATLAARQLRHATRLMRNVITTEEWWSVRGGTGGMGRAARSGWVWG